MGQRVLVCGGRNYADRDTAYEFLNRLEAERGIGVLIVGGANGADSLARDWLFERDDLALDYELFPAEWKKHGKAAGPIRNQQMLDEGKPDLVVAFPGGRGTADMVRRAIAAGVEVIEPATPTDQV